MATRTSTDVTAMPMKIVVEYMASRPMDPCVMRQPSASETRKIVSERKPDGSGSPGDNSRTSAGGTASHTRIALPQLVAIT